MIEVPFNQPSRVGREFEYIQTAISQEMHLSGDGLFSKRAQKFLEDQLGAAKVLLTSSCTDALEMAALLLRLQPGDEVIVPSFTFVSTANAFVLHGGKPVFVDVLPDTLNIDPEAVRRALSPRTRAILPVHYAGVACQMDQLAAVAAPAGALLIEDNAHGLFGAYQGRPLGSLGALASLSFHETKNVICGEGGALVINDPQWVERAEILREKGTNRNRFFRGQVDKYTWVDVGSSYLMSDLSAAFLFAQLEQWQAIQAKRRAIWEAYYEGLQTWAASRQVGLPHIPPEAHQAYHLFYLLMPSLEDRQAFIQHLAGRGIGAAFHYQALHLSAMGQQWGGRPGDCPVAERMSDCLVRLPFFYTLSDEQQAYVIESILAF